MRWTLGVAALAALLTVSGARAQKFDSQSVVLKGGVSRPTKGDVKAVGNDWWTFGAEYTLGNPDTRTTNGVELLYTGKSDNVNRFGQLDSHADYKMYSLMLNHKIRQLSSGDVAVGDVLFYGAGLGLDFIRAKVNDPNPGAASYDKKKTVAGGNIFIGYEFSANFQLEAKYQMPFSKVSGQHFDTVQILAGIKF